MCVWCLLAVDSHHVGVVDGVEVHGLRAVDRLPDAFLAHLGELGSHIATKTSKKNLVLKPKIAIHEGFWTFRGALPFFLGFLLHKWELKNTRSSPAKCLVPNVLHEHLPGHTSVITSTFSLLNYTILSNELLLLSLLSLLSLSIESLKHLNASEG